MAFALSRPSGRRADDVRALRFRVRTITFSGNYATGGEIISLNGVAAAKAQNLGLTRVLAAIPLDSVIGDPATVTGVVPKIIVSADGKTVTIKAMEDAAGAAGTPVYQEKTNAEAYLANSKLDVLFIGE